MEHGSHLSRSLSVVAFIVFELVGCDEPDPPDETREGAPAIVVVDGGLAPGRVPAGLDATPFCADDACTRCVGRAPQRAEDCQTCLNACQGYPQTISCTTCGSFCNASACDAACSGPSACFGYGMSFQPVGDPDPTIERACLALFASGEACGDPVGDGAATCRRFAQVAAPDTAPVALRCLEALPCDATFEDAYRCFPAPRRGLAQWFCEASARGGATSCDVATRDRVARADGWVLPAVATEVREACDGDDYVIADFEACVQSWLAKVELFRGG